MKNALANFERLRQVVVVARSLRSAAGENTDEGWFLSPNPDHEVLPFRRGLPDNIYPVGDSRQKPKKIKS